MIITCPECRTRYRYSEGEHAEPFQCQCSRCMSTFLSADATRPYLVVSKVECHPVGAPPAGVVPAATGRSCPEEDSGTSPAIPVIPYEEEREECTGRFSIGMDDPNLAASLEKTALNIESPGNIGMPMSYSIKAHDEPGDQPEPEEYPETGDDSCTYPSHTGPERQAPTSEDFQAAHTEHETDTPPEIFMSLDCTDQHDAMVGEEPAGEEDHHTYHGSGFPAVQERIDASEAAVKSTVEAPEVIESTYVKAAPGFGAFLFITLLTLVGAVGGWQISIILRHDPMTLAPSSGLVGLLVGWLWLRWKYFKQ